MHEARDELGEGYENEASRSDARVWEFEKISVRTLVFKDQ
jgi:hypothetical protein